MLKSVFISGFIVLFCSRVEAASNCPQRTASLAPPTLQTRSAGVLAAVSSLPASFGTGDFGPEAYRFVRFLHEAGQRWWQVLPLNPADSVNSPFKSDSSFALDVTYLSLETLARSGLIPNSYLLQNRLPGTEANFYASRTVKRAAVQLAYTNAEKPEFANLRSEFARFKIDNAYWLDAHGDFFRKRDGVPADISAFEQFLLEVQWMELKAYANQRGIALVGDMPIYVAKGSADVLGSPRAFLVDANGDAEWVSGYPPCPTYQNGQLWDTLLYDWNHLKADGYSYWEKRLRRHYALYDFVRVDHFLGFHRFYAIRAGETHARDGVWMAADGDGMLAHVAKALGPHRLIAEDLGDKIPAEVPAMLNRFGIPGMRILQFSDGTPEDYHGPSNYPPLSVAYPGNHDMPTLVEYLEAQGKQGTREQRLALHSLYRSGANVVIVPVQDLLGLGREARMNIPGTWSTAAIPELRRANWTWRLQPNLWNESLQRQTRQMAQVGGR